MKLFKTLVLTITLLLALSLPASAAVDLYLDRMVFGQLKQDQDCYVRNGSNFTDESSSTKNCLGSLTSLGIRAKQDRFFLNLEYGSAATDDYDVANTEISSGILLRNGDVFKLTGILSLLNTEIGTMEYQGTMVKLIGQWDFSERFATSIYWMLPINVSHNGPLADQDKSAAGSESHGLSMDYLLFEHCVLAVGYRFYDFNNNYHFAKEESGATVTQSGYLKTVLEGLTLGLKYRF